MTNNSIKIEGIELNIYLDNGNNIDIELTQMQTKAIFKLLGFNFTNMEHNSYTAFSDDTIAQLFEMKGNPLKLKEI